MKTDSPCPQNQEPSFVTIALRQLDQDESKHQKKLFLFISIKCNKKSENKTRCDNIMLI